MIDVEGLPTWGGLQMAPLSEARVAVAGFPYDESATYRRGARDAPALMRRLSAVMPPVDERGRCFADVTLHDLAHPDLCVSSRGGRWTCGCRLAGLDVCEVAPVGGDEITVLAALKVVFETWALL